MSDSTIEDGCFQITSLGCALFCAVLGIGGAFIASVLFYYWQTSQPPKFGVVYETDSKSLILESSNPSPVARRVAEVRFTVVDRVLPENLIGAIELKEVVFEKSNFDSSTNTFRKVLTDVEMPANGNLNLKFFVRDSTLKNSWLRGRLEVLFDDRESPNSKVYDDYRILCIE